MLPEMRIDHPHTRQVRITSNQATAPGMKGMVWGGGCWDVGGKVGLGKDAMRYCGKGFCLGGVRVRVGVWNG